MEGAVRNCERCLKPKLVCVCEAAPRIEAATRVLILQHPQEPGEYLGSAKLVELALPGSVLKVGLSWPSLAKALGVSEVDHKRWGVLFLGTVAKSGAGQRPSEPVTVVGKTGIPLPDSRQLLRSLEGLVALDGNWRQAKALWWRNAWLLKLRRLVLSPARPSLYGPLRKEPRRESLSTLESVGLTLSAIESKPAIDEELRRYFSAFLENCARNRRELHH